MKERAEKALKEMLDISTDIDKALVYSGDEVVASNFPEHLQGAMLARAKELTSVAEQQGRSSTESPVTQVVVETQSGSVFLVREPQPEGMAILATGKKDSRIGLVFYDMKTCIRDAQESDEDSELVGEG